MTEKKINITSTAIEKGIDVAKEFLDNLITPAVEETGLLLKDHVTMWRFKNQVKMLIKAKNICDKLGIKPKIISLKLLCPLLDYAALEEEETLQDKWAALLSNMVDSEQNIQNHVFPYLLSQVSLNEFTIIEGVYKRKAERVKELKAELADLQKSKFYIEKDTIDKIAQIEKKISEEEDVRKYSKEIWEMKHKKRDLENTLRQLEQKESLIIHSIASPEDIPVEELKEYEISNLIRLGVVKSIPLPSAYVGPHQIKNDPKSEYLEIENLYIEIEANEEDFILTELGELFIAACNEKS